MNSFERRELVTVTHTESRKAYFAGNSKRHNDYETSTTRRRSLPEDVSRQVSAAYFDSIGGLSYEY